MWTLYIVQLKDKKCYIGLTKNLYNTLLTLKLGKKRDKTKDTFTLVHTEFFICQKDADKRRSHLKKLRPSKCFKYIKEKEYERSR